jgi:hypothetical protein
VSKKQQFKQEAESMSTIFEEMISDYLRNVLKAAASDGMVAAERLGRRQAKKLAGELSGICFGFVDTVVNAGIGVMAAHAGPNPAPKHRGTD